MRHSLAVLALSVLFSANKCSDGKGGAASDMTALYGTKWLVTSLDGQAITLPEGTQQPWLQLSEEKRLSGFGGCNNIMGGFEHEASTIRFTQVGSTKMYCPSSADLESKVLTALRNTDGFKVDGEVLHLLQADKEVASLTKSK